jgi:signal transduction histidine kinase
MGGSLVCASLPDAASVEPVMTTAVASLPLTTRVAILTGEERAYHQLSSILSSSPQGRYASEWVMEPAAAAGRGPEVEWDVMIWDARSGKEAPVFGAGDGGAADLPLVRLVSDSAEEGDDDVESIRESELTARLLDQAVRRAQRHARLRAEIRELQAEREERGAAQEQVLVEHDRKERLLQTIMANLPLVLGRLDREGRVVETQGGGLGRCGITPASLLQQRFAKVLPASAPAVRAVLRGETAGFSLRGRRGEEEWHADFVLLQEAGHHGAIFLGRDVSERRWLEQQLLTATDAAQQRIGADLHDGLGQQLTGLACLVAALRDRLRTARQPELAAQADFVVQVANDATRQSRALARGLCPVQLEGSTLQSALSDLVHQAQQLHGISCQFRCRGHHAPLDHLTAIHLYHITQESLHNAVRHGSAGNVRVTLVSRGPRHRLTIVDDGCGFDAQQKIPSASRGLRLMHYRAGMIGGTLSITSQPGRGTRVQCQFTLAEAPHEEPLRNSG